MSAILPRVGLDVLLVGGGVVALGLLVVALLSVGAAVFEVAAIVTGRDVVVGLVSATVAHPELVFSNILEFEQTESVDGALVVDS